MVSPIDTKTVLYVEDNDINILLVEAILAPRPNVRFLTATLGSVGLALAEQHRPDLILLDLHLPDMTGDVFIAKLRAIPAIAATPIVVISADALNEQHDRFLELGIAAYVTKPFDLAEFDKVMDEFLSV